MSNIDVQKKGDSLWDHRVGITLGLLSLGAGILLFDRVVKYGDWLGVWMLVVFLAIWITIGVVSFTAEVQDFNYSDRARVFVLRAGQIVSLALLGSLFFVGAVSRGVWISPDSGETTLTHPFLTISPFDARHPVFVWNDFNQSQTLKLVTKDSRFMHCTVWTHGIRLDRRDPVLLEKQLLVFSSRLPLAPEPIIVAGLEAFLSEQASRVLSARPMSELQHPGSFEVRYDLGLTIAPKLAVLGLRWEDGRILYSCDLPPINT